MFMITGGTGVTFAKNCGIKNDAENQSFIFAKNSFVDTHHNRFKKDNYVMLVAATYDKIHIKILIGTKTFVKSINNVVA